MEIHQLKASIGEGDLNQLARQYLPTDLPVDDLRLGIVPEGIQVRGVYPMFINVNFETLWEVSVDAGRIAVRLSQFKALGIPANIFRSAILKLLEDGVNKDESLSLADDTIFVDVDRLLMQQGVPVRMNLRSVRCDAGVLVLEAGHMP